MTDITTADGALVRKGDRVWNYYDLVWCTILEDPDPQGWFDTLVEGSTKRTLLNGERIASREIRPGR